MNVWPRKLTAVELGGHDVPAARAGDEGDRRRPRPLPGRLRRVLACPTGRSRGAGGWKGRVLRSGDVIDMPEIGASVPFAEFYEGLEFRPPGADPAGA